MIASLRNRVAVTLAIFGALVSLVLATVIFLVSHDLEQRLVDETLKAELDDFVARQKRNPESLPESTATIRAFVVSADGGPLPVPPEVAGLTPGQHHLMLQGRPYRAAVRQVGAQRFAVLYDVGALQRREQGFLLLLAGSVLLVTVVSALSGRWLASRVIAPVTELARRVAELRPEDAPPPLAAEFPWSEVQQLAADFDTYLERLHAFIERERLFTGDVSHELRTPLAVIAGATELLLEDSRLDDRGLARVARIGRAVAEMSEITGALLALAREQEGPSDAPQKSDVEPVVADIVGRYRALFRDKPVKLVLEINDQPQIRADRAVLSMVLGNLLRNALSFTSEGRVTVRVQAQTIEVHDTGTGIGDVDVASLFRPYQRGEQSTGSGLGLSLVHRLCKRHGWKVELADLSAGGTIARLRFAPTGEPSAAADIPAQQAR